MQSTLFLIPHEIAGIPLFGFGWLLGCLAIGCAVWLAWSLAKKQPRSELLGALPVWIIAAGIVTFVLPLVEQRLADGSPIGLPIRGYGVMVLTGLLVGIGITIRRGQSLGIAPDAVIGLGFWMMLGGILGARAFFVIQKWEEFESRGLIERMISIVKLTEGGLVIYGGVVGGLVAGTAFCMRHRLKLAATADLIAPGFLIGLSIGRIGCLLHGCCFGGVCTAALPSIQFPRGSVPYHAQLETGELLGIELQEVHRPPGTIALVEADSPADQAELKPGNSLESIAAIPLADVDANPTAPPPLRADLSLEGMRVTFMPDQLPDWSLPVHPSQIYASINALLLCLLIWQIQPLPQRDGVAFLIAILLYALSRFLLEAIRSDEVGQLGTPFTIAQLLAIASAGAALAALAATTKAPTGRAWVWPGGRGVAAARG